ncbi:helicase [Burkholderia catarinensis]|nr:helicase [Burkholderia catarinensis]
MTLVLLVGGYVMVDRTCNADPVCRGSDASGATAIDAGLHASDDPVLPVLPAPVYPFHSTDGTPMAAARRDGPDAGESAGLMAVAQAAPSMRAPVRTHTGTVRAVNWKRGRYSAHRTHAIRRVGLHNRHTRRATTGSIDIAQLYRSH